jgi:hypothetical protein
MHSKISCGKCASITPSRSLLGEKEGEVITASFTEEILALSCEVTTISESFISCSFTFDMRLLSWLIFISDLNILIYTRKITSYHVYPLSYSTIIVFAPLAWILQCSRLIRYRFSRTRKQACWEIICKQGVGTNAMFESLTHFSSPLSHPPSAFHPLVLQFQLLDSTSLSRKTIHNGESMSHPLHCSA